MFAEALDFALMKKENTNRKLAEAGVIFLGWTLFGIFFSCQGFIYNTYFGKTVALEQILISWLSCSYIWALLTPLVIRLARQFPVERE